MNENGAGCRGVGATALEADDSRSVLSTSPRGVGLTSGSLSDLLARNQLGVGQVKNKQWTRRVDGLVRRDNPDQDNSLLFSNWLKFSLKKSTADGASDIAEDEEEEEMGNLQGGEGKKVKDGGKSPMKEKKRGFLSKKPAPKVPPVVTVSIPTAPSASSAGGAPPDALCGPEAESAAHQYNGTRPSAVTDVIETVEDEGPTKEAVTDEGTRLFATDSWRAVNKVGSRDSSSESIFMDPLTSPRAVIMPPPQESSPSASLRPTTESSSSLTQQQDDSSSLDDVTLIEEDGEDCSENFLRDVLNAANLDEPLTEPMSEPVVPCQRPTSFTLHKHRKVQLGSVSGSLALQTDVSRRHSSLSDTPSDSNVLRKVASLTLEGNSAEQKLARPKAVPEKLNYHIYDKFEGQQLLNWFVGSFPEDHYLRMLLTTQDLRLLGAHFCTHMLAAGVLRQIPDKDAPIELIFRPDLMYLWTHSESSAATPATPGRLPPGLWAQAATQAADPSPSRPGARYTEADCGTPGFQEVNFMTASTTSVDKVIRKIEAEEHHHRR